MSGKNESLNCAHNVAHILDKNQVSAHARNVFFFCHPSDSIAHAHETHVFWAFCATAASAQVEVVVWL
jgi:hypothetical protein